MKNSKVCAVIMTLMLVLMLSACGEVETTSTDILEPASVMEEVVEPEKSEEVETISVSEPMEENVSEEVIVSEEESIVEEAEVTEPISDSQTSTGGDDGGSDFATDTNLGGTEEDFMDYLEQNGFGGTYYDGDSASDDGGYQFGQGGVSDVPIANIQ